MAVVHQLRVPPVEASPALTTFVASNCDDQCTQILKSAPPVDCPSMYIPVPFD